MLITCIRDPICLLRSICNWCSNLPDSYTVQPLSDEQRSVGTETGVNLIRRLKIVLRPSYKSGRSSSADCIRFDAHCKYRGDLILTKG